MKKEIKKRVIHRLKILEGQVRGLQQMVEKEKYCLDILQQSSAIKNALSSIEDLILENHLKDKNWFKNTALCPRPELLSTANFFQLAKSTKKN